MDQKPHFSERLSQKEFNTEDEGFGENIIPDLARLRAQQEEAESIPIYSQSIQGNAYENSSFQELLRQHQTELEQVKSKLSFLESKIEELSRKPPENPPSNHQNSFEISTTALLEVKLKEKLNKLEEDLEEKFTLAEEKLKNDILISLLKEIEEFQVNSLEGSEIIIKFTEKFEALTLVSGETMKYTFKNLAETQLSMMQSLFKSYLISIISSVNRNKASPNRLTQTFNPSPSSQEKKKREAAINKISIKEFTYKVWETYQNYPSWAQQNLESLGNIEIYSPDYKEPDKYAKISEDPIYLDFQSRKTQKNKYSQNLNTKSITIPIPSLDKENPQLLEFVMQMILDFPVLERATGEVLRSFFLSIGLEINFFSYFPMKISNLSYLEIIENKFTEEIRRRVAASGAKVMERYSNKRENGKKHWCFLRNPDIKERGKIFMIDGTIIDVNNSEEKILPSMKPEKRSWRVENQGFNWNIKNICAEYDQAYRKAKEKIESSKENEGNN